MNKYVCFWRGKRVEVEAETTYAAQGLAAEKLNPSKAKKIRPEITVVLAENGDTPVVHVADF